MCGTNLFLESSRAILMVSYELGWSWDTRVLTVTCAQRLTPITAVCVYCFDSNNCVIVLWTSFSASFHTFLPTFQRAGRSCSKNQYAGNIRTAFVLLSSLKMIFCVQNIKQRNFDWSWWSPLRPTMRKSSFCPETIGIIELHWAPKIHLHVLQSLLLEYLVLREIGFVLT